MALKDSNNPEFKGGIPKNNGWDDSAYRTDFLNKILTHLSRFTGKKPDNLSIDDILNIEDKKIIQLRDYINIADSEEIKPSSLYSLLLSAWEHRRQKRINGWAYFFHPFGAAISLFEIKNKNMSGEKFNEMFSSALLHDTLEDTSLTEDELMKFSKKIGLPDVYQIVYKLTRRYNEHGDKTILLDSIKTLPELENAANNFRRDTKLKYYNKILSENSLKTTVGREALIVKILDGANNAGDTPISDEYREKIRGIGSLFKDQFYNHEKIVWKRTELSFFVNNYLLPSLSFAFANKEYFISLGIPPNRLRDFIYKSFRIKLSDRMEALPIISTEHFYRFTSKSITERINSLYKKGNLKANPEEISLKYPSVKAFLFTPQSYELILNNRINNNAVIYINKKQIDKAKRRNRLSFYIELPIIGYKHGKKIPQFYHMKVKKELKGSISLPKSSLIL